MPSRSNSTGRASPPPGVRVGLGSAAAGPTARYPATYPPPAVSASKPRLPPSLVRDVEEVEKEMEIRARAIVERAAQRREDIVNQIRLFTIKLPDNIKNMPYKEFLRLAASTSTSAASAVVLPPQTLGVSRKELNGTLKTPAKILQEYKAKKEAETPVQTVRKDAGGMHPPPPPPSSTVKPRDANNANSTPQVAVVLNNQAIALDSPTIWKLQNNPALGQSAFEQLNVIQRKIEQLKNKFLENTNTSNAANIPPEQSGGRR